MTKLKWGFIGLILFCLSYSGYAYDGNWYVSTDGTGYGTNGWADATNDLQGAITACQSGYTVWVSNGTYVVNLTIGAGVTVRSKTGLPSDVVLNGNQAGRVALMDSSSWLIGCTVSNGSSGGDADPAVYGGGIKGGSASNCIVVNNTATIPAYGGGAYSCTLYNSLLAYNSGERGGGADSCTLYNCTLYGNSAGGSAGGGGVYGTTVINTISWGNNKMDNNVTESYSCGVKDNGEGSEIGYNGTGSISTNPLFVSSSDFRLQSGSSCKDVGDNNGWVNSTDLDGNKRIWPQGGTIDMGAYEYGSEKDYPPPPPSKATNPMPTNSATKQPTTITVSWQDGGGGTTGYIINFGLPGNIVNYGSTTSTNYSLGTLLYGSNYQWRIDATNAGGATTGDVWNFTIEPLTTIIEKNKLIVSNDFQVTGNTVLNNTEIGGIFKKILKTGNTTTVAEKSYQWQTNTWVATINTNESQCNRLIGIALGTNSTSQGMLILGDLTVTNTDLLLGTEIFVSSVAGEWTQTVPTNSGYVIRAIGYATESNKISVKPDGIWGEIE